MDQSSLLELGHLWRYGERSERGKPEISRAVPEGQSREKGSRQQDGNDHVGHDRRY